MCSFWLLFMVLILLRISCSQVSPADQCQLLNATEPPQCPETIGPPCPPCIVNEFADYSSNDSLILPSSIISSIIHYMDQYLSYWLKTYPPSKIIPKTAPSTIFMGSAGRALIFLRIYNYTKNESYLNIAQNYINTALKEINRTNEDLPSCSYFLGMSGVYTIAAQIALFQKNENHVTKYLNGLQSVFDDVQNAITMHLNISNKYSFPMTDASVSSGLSGLLYNGILVNKYFGSNTIDTSYLINISHYILQIGLEFGANFNHNFLIYINSKWTSNCWLPGASEGSGGVIKMLLESYLNGYFPDLMTNESYKNAIINTMQWFMDIQFENGNIPTFSNDAAALCMPYYGNDSDARVQWCEGSPSFIDTFSLAAIVFDSHLYLKSALRAFDSTWNRGLLIKGLMQCHGIGGNTYTLLHIYKNLQIIQDEPNKFPNITSVYDMNDISYFMNQSLWRAIQFVSWTVDENNLNSLRTNFSNVDYSMWQSSYGIPLLYIQAVQDSWPNKIPVCMPGWDFCGL